MFCSLWHWDVMFVSFVMQKPVCWPDSFVLISGYGSQICCHAFLRHLPAIIFAVFALSWAG